MPVGIASASVSFAFSLTTGIAKNYSKQNKKKKHNDIAMLARSKLNSIGSTTSKVLIDNQISHEDFTIIINEKGNIMNFYENFLRNFLLRKY